VPNVGWGELLVIGLVGLLVFGPNKLPEMMRNLGKALRSFQEESGRAMQQLRDATDLSAVDAPVSSDVGVIDRPDGYEPNGAGIVLYNRNPAGLMPGEEPVVAEPPAPEPAAAAPKKRAAHAPKKRAPSASKKTTARKSPPAKKSTAAKRPAHEDT
jgi:sec-independent protein translocase protein TatA